MHVLHRKLLRDLWRLRGQVLAIGAVLAAGVAMWIVAFSTIDSLSLTRDNFYRDHAFADVFVPLTRAPLSMLQRVREIPGVREAQARARSLVNLTVPGYSDPVSATLLSLPRGPGDLNRLHLVSGRMPQARREHQVVISEAFAEAQGLEPGDTIVAIIEGRRQELTITGAAASPEFIYQIRPGELFPDYQRYAIVWMDHEALAAALDLEDAFNDLVLTLRRGADANAVIDRVDALLTDYGAAGAYARADQVSHRYLSEELKQLGNSARVVPGIFLAVSVFLLNVVLTRLIQTQREQIATLKAFGYSNIEVGIHYLELVVLIVLLGGLLGVLAGAWMGSGLANAYKDFFRFPYLDYVLRPRVAVDGVLVALAAGIAAAWFAVRQAVRLAPAQAMLPESPGEYRRTFAERATLARFLDQPTRMILRGLERRPLKSLFSVIGIAMAAAILTVGNFQEDAINYMVSVQFGLAAREDVSVTFTHPRHARAGFELARLDGVTRVEPFRVVGARLRNVNHVERISITGFDDGSELHRVLDAKLNVLALPEEGLLLTRFLADKLGLRPGDPVSVEILEDRRRSLEIPLAGVVDEFIGVGAYMRLEALNRLMLEGPVHSGAYLAVRPEHQAALFASLRQTPGVAGISIRRMAMQSFWDTMAETLLIFAAVNTLLAGAIAFGVIYNSARISFSERARELASLRVLGYTQGEVAYILLGEMLLLVSLAIPVGLVLGYGLCWLVSTGLTSDLYRIPLAVEPSTYGYSMAVILVSALLSAATVLRRVWQLDLVRVLKTRE